MVRAARPMGRWGTRRQGETSGAGLPSGCPRARHRSPLTSSPPPPMSPAPHPSVRTATDLESQIRQVRAELVFERSRRSNLLGVPVGILICSVLWNTIPHPHLLLWLGAKIAVTLWRVELTRRYDRDRPGRVLHRERQFIAALATDGVVFGLLGTVLLPRQDPVLAMAMVATLLGIAAVALVVLSINTRATLALTIPVLGSALVWQPAQGDAVSLYVGAGMAVFLALVVVEGRRAAQRRHAAPAVHRRRPGPPATAGAGPGRTQQRGEEPLPRDHEPRDAHAAARRAGAGTAAAERRRGRAPRAARAAPAHAAAPQATHSSHHFPPPRSHTSKSPVPMAASRSSKKMASGQSPNAKTIRPTR